MCRSALPHHRTCGFPHPAVEPGGSSPDRQDTRVCSLLRTASVGCHFKFSRVRSEAAHPARLRITRTQVRLRPIDPWVKAFEVQISLFDPWVKAFAVQINLFDPQVTRGPARVTMPALPGRSGCTQGTLPNPAAQPLPSGHGDLHNLQAAGLNLARVGLVDQNDGKALTNKPLLPRGGGVGESLAAHHPARPWLDEFRFPAMQGAHSCVRCPGSNPCGSGCVGWCAASCTPCETDRPGAANADAGTPAGTIAAGA